MCWCVVPPTLDEANIVDSPKIVVNRTVLLECPVSGIPMPRVRWLKNGKAMAFGRRVRRLSGGRRVKIMRAIVDDTARYTCIATNEGGQLRRNYDLQVLGTVGGVACERQSWPANFLCRTLDVGKPSDGGQCQPTRSTQPFILSGSINE